MSGGMTFGELFGLIFVVLASAGAVTILVFRRIADAEGAVGGRQDDLARRLQAVTDALQTRTSQSGSAILRMDPAFRDALDGLAARLSDIERELKGLQRRLVATETPPPPRQTLTTSFTEARSVPSPTIDGPPDDQRIALWWTELSSNEEALRPGSPGWQEFQRRLQGWSGGIVDLNPRPLVLVSWRTGNGTEEFRLLPRLTRSGKPGDIYPSEVFDGAFANETIRRVVQPSRVRLSPSMDSIQTVAAGIANGMPLEVAFSIDAKGQLA